MSGEQPAFVVEDPIGRRHRGSFDFGAVEAAATEAEGAWIRLAEPRPASFASQLRRRLSAADFDVTARHAGDAANGKATHWVYVRLRTVDASIEDGG